ncbi:MAG: RluA family pseudouridine synthase [Chlamydiales bacterium]
MKKLKVLGSTRLLTFIKNHCDFSTKDLRWSIEHGRCFVNGNTERFCSTYLKKGDEILVWPEKHPIFVKDQQRILFEDDSILFYNKPAFISSSDLAQILKLNLVHRLDRDTTGVILFSKNHPIPYENLFRERKIKKTYHLLVSGVPVDQKGIFKGKMKKIQTRDGAVKWGMSKNGVFSATEWECVESNRQYSYICCHPITGRTHQIRLHMKMLGSPVIGDREYGNKKGIPGLFRPLLHASKLAFGPYEVSAPFPNDLIRWKKKLIDNFDH